MLSTSKSKVLFGVGIVSAAAVSVVRIHYWWYLIDFANFRCLPEPFVGRPYHVLYAALGGACLFALLGRQVYVGIASIPLIHTIVLILVTVYWVFAEWRQAWIWYSESHRVYVLFSVVSVAWGSILQGTVWAMWLLAKRTPSLIRSFLFTWALTVYIWAFWGTSAVVLVP